MIHTYLGTFEGIHEDNAHFFVGVDVLMLHKEW